MARLGGHVGATRRQPPEQHADPLSLLQDAKNNTRCLKRRTINSAAQLLRWCAPLMSRGPHIKDIMIDNRLLQRHQR